VMARSAPQLNIFSLGFPITMIVGLFILSFTLSDVAEIFQGYMDTLFEFIKKLTEMR
jgi:flagellar biosynthetic protein FliR